MNQIKIAILSIIIVLTGCASIYTEGIKINDAQMAALQDKKATQQDVIAALGQPTKKETLGAKEVWKYDYAEINALGVPAKQTTVFEFDGKGQLMTHYKTATPLN
jgi:outer membrane protein assembly factor BamE